MRIWFVYNERFITYNIFHSIFISSTLQRDNAYFYNNETFYKKICLRVISLFKNGNQRK